MSIRTIIDEIENTESLKSLVETYEIIAANSMRRIRKLVLENRAFHLGLHRIHQEVKGAYEGVLLSAGRKRSQGRQPSLVKKNRKAAYVLLSTNTGLYGEIIYKTFALFMEKVRSEKPDEVVIVGKMGQPLFQAAEAHRHYTYFDFPDNKIDVESLKGITKHLTEYQKVVVFHGVFKNFLSQLPVDSHISGETLPSVGEEKVGVRYIFEPALEAVALFFETEIFASLLEQSFQESRLAKLASRMMFLDRSSQAVDSFLNKIIFQKQKFQHRVFNIKQLDAVRGVMASNYAMPGSEN